jgi:thiosulfate dehydrogenase (quinone) large subunit
MLAWKVAGYYGLDRYLLPLLGTPWHAKVEGSTLKPASASA